MRANGLELTDVATWPNWCRAAACLAGAACALAVGYWLVLADQRQELAMLVETGQDRRDEAAAKTQAADGLAGLPQRLERRQGMLAALMAAVPAVIDLPTLIEGLSRAAVESGLAIDSIDVSPERDHGFYAVMPIAVVLTGRYHQFGTFVGAAANLELLTFHDFQIDSEGGRLTLTLAMRAYRAVDSAAEGDAAVQARQRAPERVEATYDATGRSPFEEDRPAPDESLAPHGPENFALARLHMVGVLARRGVAYALVRDPTGHVHRVGAGSRLGLHGGHVARVSFDGVEVSETRNDAAGGWVRRQHRIELAPARSGNHASDEPDAPNAEPDAEALEENGEKG